MSKYISLVDDETADALRLNVLRSYGWTIERQPHVSSGDVEEAGEEHVKVPRSPVQSGNI